MKPNPGANTDVTMLVVIFLPPSLCVPHAHSVLVTTGGMTTEENLLQVDKTTMVFIPRTN